MSLVHALDKGTIIYCSMCTSPIRDVYFTHLCEYRAQRVSEGVSTKRYCFDCLQERPPCKICKASYLAKASISI